MTKKEKQMVFDRYAGRKREWCIYKKNQQEDMARLALEDCEFLESLLPNDKKEFDGIHDKIFRGYRMWEYFESV